MHNDENSLGLVIEEKLKQFIPLKKLPLNYRAVGISFRRAATQILTNLSNAPFALYKGAEQAERATVAKKWVLWGCPWSSFRAKLPFNGMRQFFVALLKEMPKALFRLFS